MSDIEKIVKKSEPIVFLLQCLSCGYTLKEAREKFLKKELLNEADSICNCRDDECTKCFLQDTLRQLSSLIRELRCSDNYIKNLKRTIYKDCYFYNGNNDLIKVSDWTFRLGAAVPEEGEFDAVEFINSNARVPRDEQT